MSHFTVLVIGDNPKQQLAKFDEKLEIPYSIVRNLSEKDIKRFMDYYSEEDKTIYEKGFEYAYLLYGKSWNGNNWKKNSNGVWEEWSNYNPNSKWDWYQLGGRWCGFFKLKENALGFVGESGVFGNTFEEGCADQCRKCDIDIEGMRNDAGDKAAEKYDRFYSIIGNRDVPDIEKYFKDCQTDYDYELARNLYYSLDIIKDLEKDKFFKDYFIFNKPSEFIESRGDYIEHARNRAILTFALVKDGEWYESGKMGWWGMVTDEKEDFVWEREFSKLIDDCPDNTLFSLFDCHI